MTDKRPLLALVASAALAACQGGPTSDHPGERRLLLDRADKTQIVQLHADGFEALPLSDKLLAYHLSQAAIAGRDINLDQRFVYNLPLRWVLESLWLVRAQLPQDVREEVERYCKLFWVHSGIHDNLSTRKNLLRLTREQFDAAWQLAEAAGHTMTNERLAPLVDLAQAYDVMTEPGIYESVTDKSTEHGKDPIAASCNNLYVGVTSAMLEGFDEKNGLNSRLVNQNGELVEEVYRAGNATVPPGRYARQIAAVNAHLRDALPFAPAPTAKAIEKLIHYNETGDLNDWREFNIAWVQDKDSRVDFTLGFIEVYLDARGIKGSWQSVISFRDEQKTEAIAALAAEAPWFEQHMPWEERFKKPDVKGISARAIAVVTETGDTGPITPIGVNLPNEADVRQEYGSKSVNLANVVDAYNQVSTGGSVDEFSFTEEEAARARKYAAQMDDLHTNLHEVVGHASGLVLPEVQNPAQRLGLYYSTLEEGRADLVGLYWCADQKCKDMGLVPDDDAVLAKYEAYARNALVQLRRVKLGERVEEDHMRNRQMIVLWLLANDGGVHVEKKDGKTFYVVDSAAKFRDGCGRLLAEIMRIKATGDFAAGKALVDGYGVKIDPALHEEVLARIEKLDLPSVTGFVQPELRLVQDADGKVTDVEVWHCYDLADQMLRWSGRR
ncbi:MAG: peptidase M49 [Planctomycetes bacterium]|nr:peptidase M49 [Planctomycetota bacterium]